MLHLQFHDHTLCSCPRNRQQLNVLGRVTKATFPDGSTLKTQYCGLTISTTNAKNQIKTTVSNAQGLTAQVYEQPTATCGTSGSLTSYVYDAFSDLLTVTDPAGNVVANNTFDIRGRKTLAIDPDMGTWSYVFDGYGELGNQTDAKSQVTSIAYDALGRVTRRNAAGFISTYVYDTASGMGIGQLASATTGSSFTKALAYDSLGRVSSVTLTEDGTPGVFTYGYDSNSRLLTLAYPSGLTAGYIYSSAGYLYQIKDNGAAKVLWTAKTRDAELHLLTQSQGNNVVTTQAFDPNTGLVQSILAGTGNAVSNQTFVFDSLGNLTTRSWLNGTSVVQENACYDTVNRLTITAITTGVGCSGGTGISYDALGNITKKGSICIPVNCMVYGGATGGPHALTSIVGTYNGVTNPTFTYDANGMMVSGAGRSITATSFDMAASITDGANTATFSYDPDRGRYKMVTTGVSAGTTYYLNAVGATEEEAIAGGTTTWRDYVMADGNLVAERFCTGPPPCSTGASMQYFVLDHLGSVAVIVSSTGSVLAQLSYDAWGKRRNPDGSAIDCTAGTAPPSSVTRGFTGQEMLDGVCLINFNARIYDPSLGRFMAADPMVGDVTKPQELNRFTYVIDNPLSMTDPSGLCFLGCFWESSIFRDILGLAVSIFLVQPELVALEGGANSLTAFDLVLNGGISGGVSGVISTGTLKGAALGALQGGLFAEAGNLLKPLQGAKGFALAEYKATAFVAHGLVGGVVSVAGGGRFGSGFLAGGFSTFAPAATQGQSWEATFEGTIESAALGGAGSEIGGGKFQNGAVTGAFSYLFSAIVSEQMSQGKSVTPEQYARLLKQLHLSSDSSVSFASQLEIDFLTTSDPGFMNAYTAAATTLFQAAVSCHCETQILRVYWGAPGLSIDLVTGTSCGAGTMCLSIPMPNSAEGMLLFQMHAHPDNAPYPSPADLLDSAHLGNVPGVIWSNPGSGHGSTWYQGRCLAGKSC